MKSAKEIKTRISLTKGLAEVHRDLARKVSPKSTDFEGHMSCVREYEAVVKALTWVLES